MATRDRALIKSFIEHKDIHGKWLARTLEVYPEYMKRLANKSGETSKKKILKAGRDAIKTDFVFASFYGSIDRSVAKRAMLPLDIAQALLKEFWGEYWEVKQWVDGQFIFYDQNGYVETLTKMVRSEILPGNEPVNSCIQGTGSHLVLDAQNALYQLAKESGDPYWMPRINVHDDLEVILPDDSRFGDYVERIVAEMLKPRYPFQICPLLVEGKLGPNFADFEEFVKAEGSYYNLDGSLVEQTLYL
jgi:DNA polymerase I-like protein with 3'-5' exonuclease and polymerase domains